jgi:hypothetical protein
MSSARVADLPVWLAPRARMGVHPRLDEPLPTHGPGVGWRLGWVTGLWLTPSLSEANPRLNDGEPWAAQRLQTLRGCTGPPVPPLAVSDDRWAAVLEALRDDARWSVCEGVLTQHPRRVYDLGATGVRLESTTANGPWTVTADGRLPGGHRQDQRPDLPQGKRMVSALEPRGRPVPTDGVPGQRADAPVYIPASTRLRAGLGQRGRLSVGDGPLGALETRAFRQAGGADAWWPVSASPLPPARLAHALAPVWTGAPAVTVIHRPQPGRAPERSAAGCERPAAVTAEGAGPPYHGRERRLGSRAVQLAHARERGLRARRAQAQAAVTARHERRRARRRDPGPSALRAAVDTRLTRARGPGLLHVWSTEPVWERPRRRSGGRDATRRLASDGPVAVRLAQVAVAAAVRQRGWRGAVTTQPPDQWSRQEAVRADRHADLVARARGRRHGRPLALTPMERERDDQATGWIRLWSVGRRRLTRLECEVRRRVALAKTRLSRWSVGHPKRATARPTAERLLEAFQGLTLTIRRARRRRRRQLTQLSRGPQHVLALLTFPVDIDTRLCPDAHKPPSK